MNSWLIAGPAIATGMAGVIAYGGAHPRSQWFGHTTCRTDSAKKLALTFDDGPNPAITPKLLELLARHNAKATFFLVGKFVRECPGLAKDIADQGHILGNHTDTHPNLFFCGTEETRDELHRCSEAIACAAWEEPRWFRPPFGLRSPWLGEIVQHHGMRTAMWTLLAGDWRAKQTEWLIERMKPVAARLQESSSKNRTTGAATTGDVLCLHDGDHQRLNSDRSHTLSALEYWLPRWRDLGLEFVTMNEVMGEGGRGVMDERAFYTEKEETRKVKLVCPSCRGEFEAPVRWKVCRKKRELPRGVSEEDRRKFAKATSFMVRLDDLVACYKCRKRFELTGQSTVLINDNLGDPNEDPENFGNR
jgi:peptidoglycan/xylan/chitin deacetylase (PgdA/CDA1 family)